MVSERYRNARRDQSMMMRQGRSFSGHERNSCFLNTGDGRFADASAVSGFDFDDDGRAIASVDWDLDGRLDLWVSNRNAPRLRFLRNESNSGNRWLAVRLRGSTSATNADGIGARVHVHISGRKVPPLSKTLRAGEGFLAQSSKWMHFGLQEQERIEGVSVDWPGGEAETFVGFDVNQRYELKQGAGIAKRVRSTLNASSLHASEQVLEPVSSAARIPLTSLTPMFAFEFEDMLAGSNRSAVFGVNGQATLLVVWASWCPHCRAELQELANLDQELRDAKINVLALCVDRIADGESRPSRATEFVRQSELPFPSGWASRDTVDQLQLVHDSLIMMSHPLPVPSSFLIDATGRLSVIYKGPLQTEWLFRDVQHSSRSRNERTQAAAQLEGSVIADPSVERSRESSELTFRLGLARNFQETGRLYTAAEHFRDAARLAPNSAEAHFGLGDVSLRQGKLSEAVRYFQAAIALNATHDQAHFRLALALEKQGRYAEAVFHYRRGLEINPSFVDGANNLAWILATNPDSRLRNGSEAVKWAEKCAEATDYQNPGILDSLAAAYAESGQYEGATRIQASAIESAPPAARPRFVERYQLYRAGKPYRDRAQKGSGLFDSEAARNRGGFGPVPGGAVRRFSGLPNLPAREDLTP